MIIVDTCVWSETMKPSPDPAVVAWLRAHEAEVALTTVTVGELLAGVALMPDGRRRDAIAVHIGRLVEQARARTYAYDEAAARAFATIVASRQSAGRRIDKPYDAMLAAIAAARQWRVATRNVADFKGMGVDVVSPWAS